eukprot:7379859-Prymnesium_polylepis.1
MTERLPIVLFKAREVHTRATQLLPVQKSYVEAPVMLATGACGYHSNSNLRKLTPSLLLSPIVA